MAGKNKGGREARKPKQAKNVKHKGQTPTPSSAAIDGMNQGSRSPKK